MRVVSFPRTQHMSPARALTRTALSEVERTNHEVVTASKAWSKIVMQRSLVVYHGISHESLVVSQTTSGSCVYHENDSTQTHFLG